MLLHYLRQASKTFSWARNGNDMIAELPLGVLDIKAPGIGSRLYDIDFEHRLQAWSYTIKFKVWVNGIFL